MIDPLDHADIIPREVIVAKINELVKKTNEQEALLDRVFKKSTQEEIVSLINERKSV